MKAIRAQDLGKLYRIVPNAPAYSTLRESLSKVFTRRQDRRSDLWAIRNLSFEIDPGELVGIVGHNGAGKSTLLKVLSRITLPTEGWVELRGHVGSLLEVGTGFHPELSGRDNIFLYGAILGMRRAAIQSRFDAIVEFSGVSRFIDTPIKFYSSGMTTRLAFAVAAHLETDILLVDEVLAVGDAEFQRRCLGKMEGVTKTGRTVIFVSHNLNHLRRVCKKGLWLNEGRNMLQGPIEDVLAAYQSHVVSDAASQELQEQLQRPNGFFSWRVTGAEQPNRIVNNGAVMIDTRMSLDRPISNAVVSLGLRTREDVLVCVWRKHGVSADRGEFRVTFRFESLPLQPGTYNLFASIWEGPAKIDQRQLLPELLVTAPERELSSEERIGLLDVPCKVDISKI